MRTLTTPGVIPSHQTQWQKKRRNGELREEEGKGVESEQVGWERRIKREEVESEGPRRKWRIPDSTKGFHLRVSFITAVTRGSLA